MILGGYDYLRLKGILERLRESPRADHRQFAALGAKLEEAEVVTPELVPENAVSLSSRVRFTDLNISPIGTALIGAMAEDVVECQAPLGVSRLRVEEVLYQPEAAGFCFV